MIRFGRSTFGLVVTVSLAFAIATLLIGAVAYELTHEALEEQLDHRIEMETRALLAVYEQAGVAGLSAAISQREQLQSVASLGYILIDRDRQRLAGTLEAEVPNKPGYVEFLYYGAGSGRSRKVAQSMTTSLPDGGMVLVAADRGAIDEMDKTLLALFAAAFGAMLVIGVGCAWTVGAVTRARLDRIDRTAVAIIGGDLAQRMPSDGSGSEFDRLSQTLNRMLDRISALIENLRQVSGDIAHDLRTPLTRLQNRLGQALVATDREAQRLAIEAALDQSHEMLEIFTAMLHISEIEAREAGRGFRPVNLSWVAEELVETYLPDAEDSGHHLQGAIAPGIMLMADQRLFQQLIANLLDNALRHTPAGTIIRLELRQVVGAVLLVVEDDGPGVPAEDLPKLFERFSRTERSRSTPGHGLGLALVAAIAAAHNGTVALRLRHPGLRAEVMLRERED